MTLKSIEKYFARYTEPRAYPWVSDMIADIEAEIAERYMELPADADGVPWHIGDMTENGNVVNGITFDRHGAHFTSTLNDIDPSIHTHFKPRTVEDVLRDYWREACELPVDMSDESTAEAIDKLVVKYRAEICELRLMGVDR